MVVYDEVLFTSIRLMFETTDDLVQALMQCVGWQYHRFAVGNLRAILMHVVSDPTVQLSGHGAGGTARANARLVFRDGTVFGITVTAARACMLDVLLAASSSLAGQRFDQSCFSTLDAAMATSLADQGYNDARVSLVQHAMMLPMPVLSGNQMSRLALKAINVLRLERGQPPICQLPANLADGFAAACSFDDPSVRAFQAALEPQVTAFQGSARAVHGVRLNCLAVYNFLAVPSAYCRNRVQAVQVSPWLLPMLIATGNGRILLEVVTVRGAIDAGTPLFDAIAQTFGVAREVVRWLGRRSLPRGWILDVARLRHLLQLLSYLPAERRPQTIAEFEALVVLGNAAIAPLGFHGDEQSVPLPQYTPCMRAWLLDIMRPGLVSATASPRFTQLASDLSDGRDFLRALFEQVQATDRLEHHAGVVCVLRWCASISVRRFLSLSRQWHAEVMADISGSIACKNGGQWPAVLSSPWQHEQLTVVELTSSAQLRAEGMAMRHCVGTYDSSCMSGSSIIVSMRSASGVSVSTAELCFRAGEAGVVLAQHRGAGNGVPSAGCTRAVDALVRHLNSIDSLELLRARQQFQKRQADIRRLQRGRGPIDETGFSSMAQRAARRLAIRFQICRRENVEQ